MEISTKYGILSVQNFYENIPKAPTLRLCNWSIKNANQSNLSPNIKSLRHRLHRKKKQPNPSSYDGVMIDQFLKLHDLSYTYPNQLILEPKL